MSSRYGGPVETPEEQRKKVQSVDISFSDFFDPTKPWVLVPNGSVLGYFDWVPLKLRMGPWSTLAVPFIFCEVYVLIMTVSYLSRDTSNYNNFPDASDYPQVASGWWYYDLVIFFWMGFVCLHVLWGPASFKAWVTYTMWSWTVLNLRHGLCFLIPLFPNQSWLLQLAEHLRLPSLLMATITFSLWNFVVGPFIYFTLDTPEKRQRMFKYFTSWRLTQVHVFNIVYAVLNCVYASPPRALTVVDGAVAFGIALAYMLFYLNVLDRVGVHLYPVFSPRTPLILISWSMVLLCYGGCFHMWNKILTPST